MQSFNLGNLGEATVIKLFTNNGIEAIKESDLNKKYDHDLVCKVGTKKFTCEVKYDAMAVKTGNIAIEYWNSKQDKPSGLSVTKADLWAHLIKDGDNIAVFAIKTQKLKDYTENNTPFKVIKSGGDKNSDIKLYKIDSIIKEFTRLDNLYEKDIKKVIKSLLNISS